MEQSYKSEIFGQISNRAFREGWARYLLTTNRMPTKSVEQGWSELMISCRGMLFVTFLYKTSTVDHAPSILLITYTAWTGTESTLLQYLLWDLELPKPHLCSRLTLFNMSWRMLRVLPQPSSLVSYLPYLRALQWDAIQPSTKKGVRNMTGQS